MQPFLDSISKDFGGSSARVDTTDGLADLFTHALDQGRFLVVMQPVVDALTWKQVHSECLIRYRGPDGPMFAAADIVPLAEKIDVVASLDTFMIQAASRLLNTLPDLKLSVNVSRRSLADQDLRTCLSGILRAFPDMKQRLIIEITETALPDGKNDLVDFIGFIRRSGLKVAIDDFGVGATSWNELANLDVDIVKFDKSLCADTDKMSNLLAETIKRAKERGIYMIAEGIDRQAGADRLRDMGVDALQGYLFGKPLP